MKKTLLTLLFSLLLAAPAAPARQGGADKQLKLEVSAAKPSYFVGESLELTFTLRNLGANPAKGSFCMGMELYNPEVWYRKDGQQFMLFVGNFPAAADRFCQPEELTPQGRNPWTGACFT
jgi:hypothetical protein